MSDIDLLLFSHSLWTNWRHSFHLSSHVPPLYPPAPLLDGCHLCVCGGGKLFFSLLIILFAIARVSIHVLKATFLFSLNVAVDILYLVWAHCHPLQRPAPPPCRQFSSHTSIYLSTMGLQLKRLTAKGFPYSPSMPPAITGLLVLPSRSVLLCRLVPPTTYTGGGWPTHDTHKHWPSSLVCVRTFSTAAATAVEGASAGGGWWVENK